MKPEFIVLALILLGGALPLLDAETADRHHRSTRDVVLSRSLATPGR
jgi:hypothetical protein